MYSLKRLMNVCSQKHSLVVLQKNYLYLISIHKAFMFLIIPENLRKIHKTGQGPGEYSMITSMLIDEESNLISLVDLGQKKYFL